jgi:SWIM zinc finger
VDTEILADQRHDSRTRERLTREARGLELFALRGDEIQQIARGLYSVPSCSARGDYLVHYDDEAESCECSDNQRRGMVCKHLYAAALFAARRRRVVRAIAPVLMTQEH